MPVWAYNVISYRGTALDGSGNMTAWFRADAGPIGMETWEPREVPGLRGDVELGARRRGAWIELEVRLASFQQTDLEAFWKLFDPSIAGTLVVADGSGRQWELTVRPQARPVILEAPNLFVVPLRATEAVLTAAGAASSVSTSGAGDSLTLNPAPAGTRSVLPTFSLVPSAAKTSFLDGYRLTARGWLANPSDRALVDVPVYLQVGNTNLRQLVRNTSPENSVTLSAAISDTATSIGYGTQVGSGVPTAGMGVLDDGHDFEQIYWTAGGGAASGTLTGVVRGIGGTTPRSWGTGTKLYRSEMQFDTRDLRVLVDGVERPSWVRGLHVRPWISRTVVSAASGNVPIQSADVTVDPYRPLIVVAVMQRGTPQPVSSVTIGDQACIQRAAVSGPDNERVEIWVAEAPRAGRQTVTVTYQSASDSPVVAIHVVQSASRWLRAATASGTSATASVTITAQAYELAIDALSTESVTTATAGSGQKERANQVNGNVRAASSSRPGTSSMSWSFSVSRNWTLAAVVVAGAESSNLNNSDILTSLSLPPEPGVRLAEGISASATQLRVDRPERLPSTIPYQIAIGNEALTVTARSGDVLTVVRGAWGTTAAAAEAGTAVLLPSLYAVMAGVARNAPAPQEEQPAISIGESSNTHWVWSRFSPSWGDGPGSWQPRQSAYVVTTALRLPAYGGLEVTDDLPDAMSLAANALAVRTPGLINLSAEVESPQAVLALEIWGDDRLLLERQAGTSETVQITQGTPIVDELELRARYNVYTGAWADISTTPLATIDNTSDILNEAGAVGVQFTLQEPVRAVRLQIALSTSAAGTQTLLNAIVPDANGLPDFTKWRIFCADIVVSGTTVTLYSTTIPLGGRALWQPGTYWWILQRRSPYNVTVQLRGRRVGSQPIKVAYNTAGTWGLRPDDTPRFLLYQGYRLDGATATPSHDQPVTDENGNRTALVAAVRRIAGTVVRPVKVVTTTAFGSGNSLYPVAGTLTNAATGDRCSVLALMPLSTTLELDAATRRATVIDGNHRYDVSGAIRADQDEWMTLMPGAQSFTWSEPAMVNTQISVKWRDRSR